MSPNVQQVIKAALVDPAACECLVWNRDAAVDSANLTPAERSELDEFLKNKFLCEDGSILQYEAAQYSGAEVLYIVSHTVGNYNLTKSGTPTPPPPPWRT